MRERRVFEGNKDEEKRRRRKRERNEKAGVKYPETIEGQHLMALREHLRMFVCALACGECRSCERTTAATIVSCQPATERTKQKKRNEGSQRHKDIHSQRSTVPPLVTNSFLAHSLRLGNRRFSLDWMEIKKRIEYHSALTYDTPL